MNMDQLLGFIYIVEYGSFTAASERLFISQSALSQQMKLLEGHLGFSLFDRSKRGTLTPAGNMFYQNARKILTLYNESIQEGQLIRNTLESNREELFIGCIEDQFLSIWLDLLHDTQRGQDQYKALALRYDNLMDLFHGILTGNCQLSIQLECEAIYSLKLKFIPFAVIPELCVFLNSEIDIHSKETMTLEELFQYSIVFHNKSGETIYEDQLRKEIVRHSPITSIIEPETFKYASLNTRYVLMVPSIKFPRTIHKHALPLAWNKGIRLGFVMSPNPEKSTQRFAQYIIDYLEKHPDHWSNKIFN